MKNLMKAFGIAILLSGVVAVTNAQTAPASSTTTKTTTQTTPDKGTPTNTKTTKTSTTAKTTTKTADKVVGKDAKGHDIYQGPKGGKYWINDKGTKVYLPAEKAAATTPAPPKK